jgi:hypothetical protein
MSGGEEFRKSLVDIRDKFGKKPLWFIITSATLPNAQLEMTVRVLTTTSSLASLAIDSVVLELDHVVEYDPGSIDPKTLKSNPKLPMTPIYFNSITT